MYLAQIGSAQLNVFIRVKHLLRGGQRNVEFFRGLFGGGWHQLHQAACTHARTCVIHKRTFLPGNGKHPAGMKAPHLGFSHQRIAVSHRETYIQVIPILRLADGANGREVPFQVVGQFGLRDHFIAVEVATDVIPLTPPVDDLTAIMKLQCPLNAGRIAHFIDQLRAEYQWFVVELIRRLGAISCQKSVKITFLGNRFEQRE